MTLTSIEIDDNLKMMFDLTKSLHNLTLKEVLRDAITEIVKQHCPAESLENEISSLEVRISELRVILTKAKQVQKHLEVDKEVSNEVDEFLEQMRNDKFKQYQTSLAVQWTKNNLNWSKIVDLYQFNSKKEAREWLQRKLIESGEL